ncbi:hypothetical protein AQJ84_38500 [Streptomyces resistomycificus]|uniref:Uncharacterized protein n=1 Tax=Streptomyces resistomycificus TaxID=67356 RepID=A0A0L8LI11_9ACTN|nr:hypothetical protein ADK37_11030 [Streptomyces resistomycificus]KUN90889.1 hypothetical protein AQJ84_38500 [Streptomyces resistomycificus]
MRLHGLTPDAPLPRDGVPYPDEERRRSRPRPEHPRDREQIGADVAAVLDENFSDPRSVPDQLVGRFHGIHVPIHPNPRVAAAALRGGARAREAGRRLVRHGTDTDDVVVGLSLLAAVGTVDDVPYIQTVGLLSCTFGPLAAHAMERLPDGAGALLWLADRVAGWGRVYVVEALCRLVEGHPDVRHWLLRNAVDGDFLNGYFAGKVALAAGLHQALVGAVADAEVVEHAGSLLHVLTSCQGMGMTLAHYPHAEEALAALLRHLERLGPSPSRYYTAALLAGSLGEHGDEGSIESVGRWQTCREGYVALLEREEWCETARNAIAADDHRLLWLAESASHLVLRAFGDLLGPPRKSAPQE